MNMSKQACKTQIQPELKCSRAPARRQTYPTPNLKSNIVLNVIKEQKAWNKYKGDIKTSLKFGLMDDSDVWLTKILSLHFSHG